MCEIWGSQNIKSGSRDPFLTPFDLILHFFSLVLLVMNPHAKFDITDDRQTDGRRHIANVSESLDAHIRIGPRGQKGAIVS